jgi:hypothetical protein
MLRLGFFLDSVQVASHRKLTGAEARGARAGSRHVLEADEGRAVHASILFAPEHGAFIVPGKSRAWGIYCTLKIAPGHGAWGIYCTLQQRFAFSRIFKFTFVCEVHHGPLLPRRWVLSLTWC